MPEASGGPDEGLTFTHNGITYQLRCEAVIGGGPGGDFVTGHPATTDDLRLLLDGLTLEQQEAIYGPKSEQGKIIAYARREGLGGFLGIAGPSATLEQSAKASIRALIRKWRDDGAPEWDDIRHLVAEHYGIPIPPDPADTAKRALLEEFWAAEAERQRCAQRVDDHYTGRSGKRLSYDQLRAAEHAKSLAEERRRSAIHDLMLHDAGRGAST